MLFLGAMLSQASLTTYIYSVTAAQLASAYTSQTGGCLTNLTNCGIYGVGFKDLLGTVSITYSATPAQNTANTNLAGSPVPSGSATWFNANTINGNEAGFSSQFGPDTNVSFITNGNAGALAGTYSNLGSGVTSISSISGSTTLKFNVTVQGAAPTNAQFFLLLDPLANGTTDTARGSLLSTLVGVTLLASQITATPEPATLAMFLSGIAAFALRRRFSRLKI